MAFGSMSPYIMRRSNLAVYSSTLVEGEGNNIGDVVLLTVQAMQDVIEGGVVLLIV